MPTSSAPGDDDRLPDARVRRRGRAARRRAGVRDRSLPRARRSVAGRGDPDPLLTTRQRSVAAIRRGARGHARSTASSPSAIGRRSSRARVGRGARACRVIRPRPPRSRANKQRTRERLRDAGPARAVVRADADRRGSARRSSARSRFPACVKPLALSGSRGVMRADDADAVRRGVRPAARAPAVAGHPRRAQRRARRGARRRVHPGPRVRGRRAAASRRAARAGDLRQARSARRPVLRGNDLRHAVAASPRRRRRRLSTPSRARPTALGLSHGPVHAECRVNDAGVFVLEVAARPIGGLCARALRFDRTGREHRPTADLARGTAAAPCAWANRRTSGRARRARRA